MIILCKSKHFPRRYTRKREWVFFSEHSVLLEIGAVVAAAMSRHQLKPNTHRRRRRDETVLSRRRSVLGFTFTTMSQLAVIRTRY